MKEYLIPDGVPWAKNQFIKHFRYYTLENNKKRASLLLGTKRSSLVFADNVSMWGNLSF
jgi:hypothetical protein